jgi:hypothetical protein
MLSVVFALYAQTGGVGSQNDRSEGFSFSRLKRTPSDALRRPSLRQRPSPSLARYGFVQREAMQGRFDVCPVAIALHVSTNKSSS